MTLVRLENGNIYVSKGTPFPYLCPKCGAIVPCTKENFNLPTQTCWACNYSGEVGEFDVGWEFRPAQ